MTVAKAKAATKVATVYGKAPQGQKRGRELFSGTPEDAETFIANNFPREHSEEAGPDYTMESGAAPEESGD